MKIVRNKFIPFQGYKAINLFGILFVRSELKDVDINHEAIHTAQIKEMFFIFFYIWYFIEWIIRLVLFKKGNPYRGISFEVEAYYHQDDLDYLNNRKHFSWLKYIFS